MAETAVQYFTRICKEAGKTDAEITALVALAQDPKVSAQLEETIRRSTDDFHAMKGRYESTEQKLKDQQDWNNKYWAEHQRLSDELKAAKAGQNGHEDFNNPPAFDASKYLTLEQLEKFNAERDARYANVIKQATRLASRHAATYGEELDVDAVEKIALEKNLPIDQAYRTWISPREEKAREEKHKKDIEAAKAEAVRDYASQHRLPVDPKPIEVAPIHRSKTAEAPKDIDAELMAAWNGAAQ